MAPRNEVIFVPFWRGFLPSGGRGHRAGSNGVSLVFGLFSRLFIWFLVLVCYAVTELATQLPQRRIHVVRSNRVARKRPAESNGTFCLFLFGFESTQLASQLHQECTKMEAQ